MNYKQEAEDRARSRAAASQQAGASGARPRISPHPILRLQRLVGNRAVNQLIEGSLEVAPEVEQSIHSARTEGAPLDASAREPMESTFGVDFSGVRIHD